MLRIAEQYRQEAKAAAAAREWEAKVAAANEAEAKAAATPEVVTAKAGVRSGAADGGQPGRQAVALVHVRRPQPGGARIATCA